MGDEITEWLATIFTYHKPFGNQPEMYADLRARAHSLAQVMYEYCGDTREFRIAIGKLEQAIMYANASIARNESEV